MIKHYFDRISSPIYAELGAPVHSEGEMDFHLDSHDPRFRIFVHDPDHPYRALVDHCQSLLTSQFRKELAESSEVFFVKTHELPFQTYFDGERVVRIIRHPLATLWSYYCYLKELVQQSVMMEEVVAGSDRIQNWSQYTQAWLEAEKALGASHLKVRYEDIVQSEESFVNQLLEWTHLPLKNSIGTFPEFEHWHQLWPQFYRGGQNDEWKKKFKPEHFILLYQHHAEAMAQEGYSFDFAPPVLSFDYDTRTRLARLGMVDVENLPKVEDAGQVHEAGNLHYQVMFNGVKVPADGYYGSWQSDLIRLCRGHHEPQEEYIFNEIVRHAPEGAAMIELGSYWAFYSTWFLNHVKGSKAVLVEPKPESVVVSLATLALNQRQANIEMAIVGVRPPEFENIYLGATDRPNYVIPLRTVDELMETYAIAHLYVLHSDIQGAELEMLEGAKLALESHRIDYLVISTHSYAIHQACLEKLATLNYRVIAEHDEFESYSYDGLIVACADNLHEINTLKIHKRTAAEWTWAEAVKSWADTEGLLKKHDQVLQSGGDLRARFEQLQNERAVLQQANAEQAQTIEQLRQQIGALRRRKIVRVMAKLGRPLI